MGRADAPFAGASGAVSNPKLPFPTLVKALEGNEFALLAAAVECATESTDGVIAHGKDLTYAQYERVANNPVMRAGQEEDHQSAGITFAPRLAALANKCAEIIADVALRIDTDLSRHYLNYPKDERVRALLGSVEVQIEVLSDKLQSLRRSLLAEKDGGFDKLVISNMKEVNASFAALTGTLLSTKDALVDAASMRARVVTESIVSAVLLYGDTFRSLGSEVLALTQRMMGIHATCKLSADNKNPRVELMCDSGKGVIAAAFSLIHEISWFYKTCCTGVKTEVRCILKNMVTTVRRDKPDAFADSAELIPELGALINAYYLQWLDAIASDKTTEECCLLDHFTSTLAADRAMHKDVMYNSGIVTCAVVRKHLPRIVLENASVRELSHEALAMLLQHCETLTGTEGDRLTFLQNQLALMTAMLKACLLEIHRNTYDFCKQIADAAVDADDNSVAYSIKTQLNEMSPVALYDFVASAAFIEHHVAALTGHEKLGVMTDEPWCIISEKFALENRGLIALSFVAGHVDRLPVSDDAPCQNRRHRCVSELLHPNLGHVADSVLFAVSDQHNSGKPRYTGTCRRNGEWARTEAAKAAKAAKAAEAANAEAERVVRMTHAGCVPCTLFPSFLVGGIVDSLITLAETLRDTMLAAGKDKGSVLERHVVGIMTACVGKLRELLAVQGNRTLALVEGVALKTVEKMNPNNVLALQNAKSEMPPEFTADSVKSEKVSSGLYTGNDPAVVRAIGFGGGVMSKYCEQLNGSLDRTRKCKATRADASPHMRGAFSCGWNKVVTNLIQGKLPKDISEITVPDVYLTHEETRKVKRVVLHGIEVLYERKPVEEKKPSMREKEKSLLPHDQATADESSDISDPGIGPSVFPSRHSPVTSMMPSYHNRPMDTRDVAQKQATECILKETAKVWEARPSPPPPPRPPPKNTPPPKESPRGKQVSKKFESMWKLSANRNAGMFQGDATRPGSQPSDAATEQLSKKLAVKLLTKKLLEMYFDDVGSMGPGVDQKERDNMNDAKQSFKLKYDKDQVTRAETATRTVHGKEAGAFCDEVLRLAIGTAGKHNIKLDASRLAMAMGRVTRECMHAWRKENPIIRSDAKNDITQSDLTKHGDLPPKRIGQVRKTCTATGPSDDPRVDDLLVVETCIDEFGDKGDTLDSVFVNFGMDCTEAFQVGKGKGCILDGAEVRVMVQRKGHSAWTCGVSASSALKAKAVSYESTGTRIDLLTDFPNFTRPLAMIKIVVDLGTAQVFQRLPPNEKGDVRKHTELNLGAYRRQPLEKVPPWEAHSKDATFLTESVRALGAKEVYVSRLLRSVERSPLKGLTLLGGGRFCNANRMGELKTACVLRADALKEYYTTKEAKDTCEKRIADTLSGGLVGNPELNRQQSQKMRDLEAKLKEHSKEISARCQAVVKAAKGTVASALLVALQTLPVTAEDAEKKATVYDRRETDPAAPLRNVEGLLEALCRIDKAPDSTALLRQMLEANEDEPAEYENIRSELKRDMVMYHSALRSGMAPSAVEHVRNSVDGTKIVCEAEAKAKVTTTQCFILDAIEAAADRLWRQDEQRRVDAEERETKTKAKQKREENQAAGAWLAVEEAKAINKARAAAKRKKAQALRCVGVGVGVGASSAAAGGMDLDEDSDESSTDGEVSPSPSPKKQRLAPCE